MTEKTDSEEKSALVVATTTEPATPLVGALASLGYAVAARRDIGKELARGAVVCFDVSAWRRPGDGLDDLVSSYGSAVAEGSTGTLVLFEGGANTVDGSGYGTEEGLRRTVRALANELAPRARVNAVTMDARASGLKGALRLILESPSMTGQTLRLSSMAGPALRPSLEGEPPPGRPGRAAEDVRRMFIRDLVIPAFIGVHRHEKSGRQRVRINVDLDVLETGPGSSGDRLADVVCYETMANRIREAAGSGHVNLVETLAERVAQICLADARVLIARVRIEKLDVFPDAVSAGVEITRRQVVP